MGRGNRQFGSSLVTRRTPRARSTARVVPFNTRAGPIRRERRSVFFLPQSGKTSRPRSNDPHALVCRPEAKHAALPNRERTRHESVRRDRCRDSECSVRCRGLVDRQRECDDVERDPKRVGEGALANRLGAGSGAPVRTHHVVRHALGLRADAAELSRCDANIFGGTRDHSAAACATAVAAVAAVSAVVASPIATRTRSG